MLPIGAAGAPATAAATDGVQLALPARLVEEALVQDDQHLRIDEVCTPGVGSADYSAEPGPHFEVRRVTAALPAQLGLGPPGAGGDVADPRAGAFVRQGVLPEIQRLWRSFDSTLVLWQYLETTSAEVIEYQGVTQQLVGAMVARPKGFVTGVDYFLVLATPVEVSLHALCFAPGGGGRLLPPVRTQHAVATDDVVVTAMASDPETGRIFLGGADGCIHELQYFDGESRWFGRPRKCRKTTVCWNLQSQLPTLLRKASEALFGPAEGVAQLLVDSARGFLFSLSTGSSVMVFQLPRPRAGAGGKLEEQGLVQVCTLQQSTLAAEVARVRGQLFPGLVPGRGTGPGQLFGGGGVGAAPLVPGAAAQTGPKVKIAKLFTLDAAEGGSLVACAVAQDGTRIFLRGNTRPQPTSAAGAVPAQGPRQPAGPGGKPPAPPTLISLAVHHIRFFDANSPPLIVKDVARVGGTTLLLGRMTGAGFGARFPPCGAALASDVIVVFSPDLRAVAQRQSRGRSPWLGAPQGFSEHMEVLRIDAGREGYGGWEDAAEPFEAVALSPLVGILPQAIDGLYSAPSANGNVLPVFGLSELAQQQLLPPARCALISNQGVHVLTKVQPLDAFRQLVLKGDVPNLREFALQYTAEQTCALCFQLLTAVAPRLAAGAGAVSVASVAASLPPLRPDGQDDRLWQPGGSGGLAGPRFGDAAGGLSFGQQLFNRAAEQRLREGVGEGGRYTRAEAAPRAPAADAVGQAVPLGVGDEVLLLRTEHVLLTPKLASLFGLVQTWPCVDTTAPWAAPTALGHTMPAPGARLDGRLRGLCLYLSRILRPLWLTPVMSVSWRKRAGADKGQKRRHGDWWPPPPEPRPVVQGSTWRCTWSKQQRSYVMGQLQRLHVILERCKGHLVPEDAFGNSAVAGVGMFAGGGAYGGGDPSAPTGLEIVNGLVLLIGTATEALAFLELASVNADALGAGLCPPEALVQFAELTFRDLVCKPEARAVLQQLMRGGVVACQQLHAKCPRLFSAVDLEVQQAYELLAVVQQNLVAARMSGSSADLARFSHLVQRPLRALWRHAASVDLAEAAARLRAVGACKGLVALCVRIARVRDPKDESLRPRDPTSAHAQQLHYARLECYQVVVEILEDLYVLAQQHCGGLAGGSSSSPFLLGANFDAAFGGAASAAGGRAKGVELPELLPLPLAAGEAVWVLDALLRHCLEDHMYGADELFHFCILKWMLQRELPAYRYHSPYVRGFLESSARDQPELLCRYYQHRGRWAEACDAYMALARRQRPQGAAVAQPQRESEERLVLLQSAALCAKMPGSGRRTEPILRAIDEELRRQQTAPLLF